MGVIVAPVPGSPDHTPLTVFRGADLATGSVRPHLLVQGAEGGWFRRVEQVGDVNGDGQTEVVVSYEYRGSGQNVHWLMFQWQGSSYRRIFDVEIENWRGPNWLVLDRGKIRLTCRPMGTYDHKHAPHRQVEEDWTWQPGGYRLAARRVPPPPTMRQQINDAERRFRRQDYDQALALYTRAQGLPREPGDRDWRSYIHLRLGQTLALLDRWDESRRAFQRAAAYRDDAGRAAQAFLKAAAAPETLPTALAAIWQVQPAEPAGRVPWRPTRTDLSPPPVAVQAYLQRHGVAELTTRMPGAGINVLAARVVDLDGDGTAEAWIRLEQGSSEARHTDVLAARTGTGWRVGEVFTGNYSEPEIRQLADGRYLRFDTGAKVAWPDEMLVGWDGATVQRIHIGNGATSRFSSPLLPPGEPQCRE